MLCWLSSSLLPTPAEGAKGKWQLSEELKHAVRKRPIAINVGVIVTWEINLEQHSIPVNKEQVGTLKLRGMECVGTTAEFVP